MNGPMRRGGAGALALAATCAVALCAPALSGAARHVYAPGAKAHTLNGGPGGWKATDSQSGMLGEEVCVAAGVLICPSATSTYQADGGASGEPGDGFVGTEFAVTAGVGGTGTSVWKSKSFVYRGMHGKQPRRVHFKAKRTSALTEVLTLPSATATYTAQIVPKKGGNPIEVGAGDIPAASDWTKLQIAKVSRRALKRAQRYSLEITSTYETGLVGVNKAGTLGYDNVKLVAQRKNKH